MLYGLGVALPWLAVFRVSWERTDFQGRETALSFRQGLLLLARHGSFRRLTGLYLCSRITMDIAGAMLILYFTFVIGRSGDFEVTMGLFLAAVLVSLPIWLAISRHTDKSTLFVIGSVWWFLSFGLIYVADPGWPRWLLIGLAPIGGVGFAVVDLMAWSMLGEVIDEDDLASGERREGIYNGAFMFVRKLGGSIAVALALGILGWLGFNQGEEQPETVLTAIRLLTTAAPAVFLTAAVVFARGYPLSRARHAEIVAAARGSRGRPLDHGAGRAPHRRRLRRLADGPCGLPGRLHRGRLLLLLLRDLLPGDRRGVRRGLHEGRGRPRRLQPGERHLRSVRRTRPRPSIRSSR